MKLLNKYNLVGLGILLLFTGCSQKTTRPLYVPKPIVEQTSIPVNSDVVGVTGAAGELKRITYGGNEELVSDVSNDGQWLLIDAYSFKNGVRSNTIIQKINLMTGSRMILSPSNSSNSRGVWSFDDSNFIFTTNRTGSSAIVQSMGASGETGIRFITNGSLGKATDANFNQTSSDIAFVLNGSISLVKPDGTEIRMFGSGYLPKFSPDGNKILFTRYAGDFLHLFTMNTNGTFLMEITAETANDFEGSWSPDGSKIAFISDRATQKHLYVMDNNGANVTQLTEGNFDISSLHWADDGFIYFSANAGGNRDIWKLKPINQ